MRFKRAHLYVLCGAVTILRCLSVAPAAQDPSWENRNLRSGPPRYEGLLDQPNARREYDVLSFLIDSGQVLPDQPDMLRVEVCRPRSSAFAQFNSDAHFLEVRQKSLHINYLMKPRQPLALSDNSSWYNFTWPTKDVIKPNNIKPRNLGVVVHLGEDSEYAEDISPAILTTAHSVADPVVNPGFIDNYLLVLRIQQQTLSDLSYTFRLGGAAAETRTCYYTNEAHGCEPRKPGPHPPIESGSMVTLPLHFKPDQPDGVVYVHIEGGYKDSDEKLIVNFRFPHQRLCE